MPLYELSIKSLILVNFITNYFKNTWEQFYTEVAMTAEVAAGIYGPY